MLDNKKKIFILMPDGVSLRNFAYSQFCEHAIERNIEIVFWHHTPFELNQLELEELKLKKPKLHWLTNIFKNARKRIEISRFVKRHKDPIYNNYLFPLTYKGLKSSFKSLTTQLVVLLFNSESGLKKVRRNINLLEQKTTYFKSCKEALIIHKPDLVYCTSQRSVLAIAPLLAAKQLKIPTVTFIFSWDNLPKATLDVTADYYNVWSEHMKNELLHYHPFINEDQVKTTGTPQFEPHYRSVDYLSKSEFYSLYNLDSNKTYLCYSGDDVTTSPKDPLYLRDVALAIRELNKQGYNLKLIFRRCPVDFSDRYDPVISLFEDEIVPIAPKWSKLGSMWDTILPLKEDLQLLTNLALHTAGVINLGSSMVFDFAIHKKPCFYMNYNYFKNDNVPDQGVYVYDYVHFRSKPNNDVVIWLNNPKEIENKIKKIIKDQESVVFNANLWYQKINMGPQHLASQRIVSFIEEIIKTQN